MDINNLKNGVLCQISPDVLDRFSQSFHHMKALNAVSYTHLTLPTILRV